MNKKQMNKRGVLTSAVLLALALGNGAQAATVNGKALPLDAINYDRLTLGMQSFLDATRTKTDTDGVSSTEGGLNVGRLYLDIRYYVDKTWMFRFTSDVNNEQPSNANLKRNENVFLKYAYLEGNFMPQLQLRLGMSHTPMIAWAQDTWWQHRYVSQVMIDRLGYDNSSDAGVGLKGKLAGGLFEYWGTVTNGGGFSKPGTTSRVDYDLRGTLYPVKGLNISYQVRSGYRGTADEVVASDRKKSTLNHIMASYGNGSMYRIGFNVAENSVRRDSDSAEEKHKAGGVWGFYNFSDYGVMARYEKEKVDTFNSAMAQQKQTHYLVGLEYRFSKAVRSSLIYSNTKYDNYKYVAGSNSKVRSIGVNTQFSF